MYDPARDTFTGTSGDRKGEADHQKKSRSPISKPSKRKAPQDDGEKATEEASPAPQAKRLKIELNSRKPSRSPAPHPDPLPENPSAGSRRRKPASSASRDARDARRSPVPSKVEATVAGRRKRVRSSSRDPRDSRETRRSPIRRVEASEASKRDRSPSPIPRSPPRERKRPGGTSRLTDAERDTARKLQAEREQQQLQTAQEIVQERGVHDMVRQHYNAVPERGRDWRRTDSRIKGLRSYNNWVKSTLIQKFSPHEGFSPSSGSTECLLVLDIGCGKGGDIGKWQKAPQRVELYIGVDPAEVSIAQAKERYEDTRRKSRGRIFEGHFFAKDGYSEWIGEIPIVKQVGVDPGVGPGGGGNARWGGGGFDVVTMMFCMHYAFESEAKARGMLRNVAGALKKGGRFLGVIPNSDVHRAQAIAFHKRQQVNEASGDPARLPEDGEVAEASVLEWGNSIYHVRYPGPTPADGIFRPPWGWRYNYFMEEAVEEVPEYVVPWEAFRAMAEDYNLEMQYRKPFLDIYAEEKDDLVLGPLCVRMNVRDGPRGELQLTEEEREAVGFYHAFCFYKV